MSRHRIKTKVSGKIQLQNIPAVVMPYSAFWIVYAQASLAEEK
jgi:hypothetical protein